MNRSYMSDTKYNTHVRISDIVLAERKLSGICLMCGGTSYILMQNKITSMPAISRRCICDMLPLPIEVKY